jgi:hypothetical protein
MMTHLISLPRFRAHLIVILSSSIEPVIATCVTSTSIKQGGYGTMQHFLGLSILSEPLDSFKVTVEIQEISRLSW